VDRAIVPIVYTAEFVALLGEEGVPLRDVRKGLALDYLESSDLSLEEIAALLGCEDAANFNRAFRRWVGDAPGRYRSTRAGLARPWALR
jgi:AraC-like DNA-binding protein